MTPTDHDLWVANEVLVQLDCCAEVRDLLEQVWLSSGGEVWVRMVELEGPGGCNPLVELRGPEVFVQTVLGDVWGLTQAEALQAVREARPLVV